MTEASHTCRKAGTPALSTFRANLRVLTDEDLQDPRIQEWLRGIAADTTQAESIRALARKFIKERP